MNGRRLPRHGFEDEQRIILDYVEWERQICHAHDSSFLALRRGPTLAIAAYLILAFSELLGRL